MDIMLFTFSCLKKLASILFLLILVFNFFGYKWVLSYLEQKATLRLEQKIDAGNYDESQLVEVKIPLNLPYYTDWSGYQSYYGEAQINGESYQYIKRKIVADTLYLLCIRHAEKNNIQAAKSDYFKAVNDLQPDGTQKGNQRASVKLMLSEFLLREEALCNINTYKTFSSFSPFGISFITQFNPLTEAQPPEC